MAKFCPILNRKVVYLDCLECDDKQCEQSKTKQDLTEQGEQNKCHSTKTKKENKTMDSKIKENVDATLNHLYKREDELSQIRAKYPEGTSIHLIKMGSDPQPVPPHTLGTVKFVDDMGTIHMCWKTGSSLGLIIGEDEFEIIHPTKVTLEWSNGTKMTRVFARESEAIVFVAEANMTCEEKRWAKPEVTYEKAKVGDLPDAYY